MYKDTSTFSVVKNVSVNQISNFGPKSNLGNKSLFLKRLN